MVVATQRFGLGKALADKALPPGAEQVLARCFWRARCLLRTAPITRIRPSVAASGAATPTCR
jgi:hypothetical protein